MTVLLVLLVAVLALFYPAAALFSFAALAVYLFVLPAVAVLAAGAAAAMHHRGRRRLRDGFLIVTGVAVLLGTWLFASMERLPFGH